MFKLSLIIILNFFTFLDALSASFAQYYLSVSLVFLSFSALSFNFFINSSTDKYFLSSSFFLIVFKSSLDSLITFLSELLEAFFEML